MTMVLPKRGEQGFTLIELMIVIAIIGILAAIAIPQFAAYRARAANSAALSDARNLSTAQEVYYGDKATYATGWDQLKGGRYGLGERSDNVTYSTGNASTEEGFKWVFWHTGGNESYEVTRLKVDKK